MISSVAAKRYAKALHELAQEKDMLKQIEEELSAVVEAMQNVKELHNVIYNPRVREKDKKAILRQIFEGQVSTVTLNFLCLLVDKHRENLIESILTQYIEMANETLGIVKAVVKTAVPLNASQIDRISDKLCAMTGKKITLSTEVDKSIIGGVVIRIGDEIIDGSVAHKLERLRAKLENIQVSELGVRS